MGCCVCVFAVAIVNMTTSTTTIKLLLDKAVAFHILKKILSMLLSFLSKI